MATKKRYGTAAVKKNSGHAPKYNGLAKLRASCPNQQCSARTLPGGQVLIGDKSIPVTPGKTKRCGTCGTPLPKGGYTVWP